jgi:hypothetical protein
MTLKKIMYCGISLNTFFYKHYCGNEIMNDRDDLMYNTEGRSKENKQNFTYKTS